MRPPTRSPLFPYTTLFRSLAEASRGPLRALVQLGEGKERLPFMPVEKRETQLRPRGVLQRGLKDRKSTRLNSSHSQISYAVFCLKKKKSESPAPAESLSLH